MTSARSLTMRRIPILCRSRHPACSTGRRQSITGHWAEANGRRSSCSHQGPTHSSSSCIALGVFQLSADYSGPYPPATTASSSFRDASCEGLHRCSSIVHQPNMGASRLLTVPSMRPFPSFGCRRICGKVTERRTSVRRGWGDVRFAWRRSGPPTQPCRRSIKRHLTPVVIWELSLKSMISGRISLSQSSGMPMLPSRILEFGMPCTDILRPPFRVKLPSGRYLSGSTNLQI